MRKLVLALAFVLGSAGVVYAGCFGASSAGNFSPTTVSHTDYPRMALQCYALRVGGSWTIASNGRSATKSGGGSFNVPANPLCGSNSCTVRINDSSGNEQLVWSYGINGTTMNQMHFHAFAEDGQCQPWFESTTTPPNVTVLVARVKYCRP